MICPHCDKDTSASLPYCQICGLSLDLTLENVQASFQHDAETRAERETEERCRTWLLFAAAALAIAIAARLLLVPAAPRTLVLPAYVPAEDAAALRPVEPLPFDVPALEIPR